MPLRGGSWGVMECLRFKSGPGSCCIVSQSGLVNTRLLQAGQQYSSDVTNYVHVVVVVRIPRHICSLWRLNELNLEETLQLKDLLLLGLSRTRLVSVTGAVTLNPLCQKVEHTFDFDLDTGSSYRGGSSVLSEIVSLSRFYARI